MGRVTGKVALVTGAARGQGAEHARLLAREGASVVVSDVLDDLGIELVSQLRAEGLPAEYLHLDVGRDTEWTDVVARTEELYGKLDVLVNNAGIVQYAGAADCTDEEWDRVLRVNQTGVFYGMRAAIPAMRRAGSGSIVNITSVFGACGGARGYIAYGATKAAVMYMTQSAALCYGKDGIRANAIAPGALDTPMLREEADHHGITADSMGTSNALNRIATPDETSPAVVYFASDESSFVTGALLVVDGGVTAAASSR